MGPRVCEYDGAELVSKTVEGWLAVLEDDDQLDGWLFQWMHQLRGRLGLRQVVLVCRVCGTLTTDFLVSPLGLSSPGAG